MVDEIEKNESEETKEKQASEISPEASATSAPKKRAIRKTKKAEPKVEKAKKEEPSVEKEVLKKKRVEKIDKVDLFNRKNLRSDIPIFKAGDTLRVHYRIIEGDKTRIQVFEGVCIARKHGGINETITVRKMSGSVGVERTFFLHSRRIEKVDVKKVGDVRRAKIYFLRGRTGKAARIRELSLH